MGGSRGYLTLGRWEGARVRAHWTLPLGALVFGGGRFVPGFWLGFFLLVLIHEVGHALLVRRRGYRVVSIDIHGVGGECRWQGEATPIHRAQIAWGGVHAQLLAFAVAAGVMAVVGEPRDVFTAELASAFTTTNVMLIALNLIPVPPLDGAEAWKLPRLLRERAARRAARAQGDVRTAVERELARLDASDRAAPASASGESVDEALRRLAGPPKKGN